MKQEDLIISFEAREIRDSIEAGGGEEALLLDVLTDEQLEDAAYAYLADQDEPWRFFTRAARQIVRDAHETEVQVIANAYSPVIEKALSGNNPLGDILMLLENAIREERQRMLDKD